METVCRICLEPFSFLIDLKTCRYEQSPLSYYEIFVTIVDVLLDDTESSLICLKCKNLLNSAYELRVRAKKSTDYLRSRRILFVEAKSETIFEIKKEEIVADSYSEIKKEKPDVKEDIVSDDLADIDWNSETNVDVPKLDKSVKVQLKQKIPRKKSEKSHWDVRCRFCLETYKTCKRKSECENRHIKDNNGLECHHCGYKTFKRNRLHQHLKIHQQKKVRQTFICQICGRELRSRHNVRDHVARFHRHDQENVRKMICDLCGKRFVLHTEIKKHIETVHLNHRNFSCTLCKNSYKRKLSLRHHMEAEHPDGQKFICTICGKNLKTSQSYYCHQIVHTGEFKYKCDFEGCLSMFRHKNSLKSHKLLHQPAQLQCEYCPKRFRHASALKAHIHVHVSGLMHKCKLCEKSYAVPFLLKEHVEVVHQGKRYDCPACGCKLTSKNNLKRHVQLHCTQGVKKRV